jgi:hypothetical protein
MTNPTSAQGSIAPGSASHAAEMATSGTGVRIVFEGIGTVDLPPKEDLAFFAGLGLLAVAGILEWPLAGILAAGHVLTRYTHNKALQEFGEALEAV